MNTEPDFIRAIVNSVSMNMCIKIFLLYLFLFSPSSYLRLENQNNLIILLFILHYMKC